MSAGDNEDALRRHRIENVAYVGRTTATKQALQAVLHRLPDAAVEIASRCVFTSVGSEVARAQCIGSWVFGSNVSWFIVLYDLSLALELDISHEIAHAYLGHGDGLPGPSEDERERDVQDLLRKWGFIENDVRL